MGVYWPTPGGRGPLLTDRGWDGIDARPAGRVSAQGRVRSVSHSAVGARFQRSRDADDTPPYREVLAEAGEPPTRGARVCLHCTEVTRDLRLTVRCGALCEASHSAPKESSAPEMATAAAEG